VLDHLLHGKTSHDVAPRLREAAPGTQVMLISGMPQPELSQIADDVGADAYASKTLKEEEICDLIRRLGRATP
jgi:DNA-binding NarL/FixJ family response regulator